MKVLLDEQIPHEFRHALVGHDVFTVSFMRWSGVKNGELLLLANHDGFDVMITMDRELALRYSTIQPPISLVFIAAISNRPETLLPLVPGVLAAINSLPPETLVEVH